MGSKDCSADGTKVQCGKLNVGATDCDWMYKHSDGSTDKWLGFQPGREPVHFAEDELADFGGLFDGVAGFTKGRDEVELAESSMMEWDGLTSKAMMLMAMGMASYLGYYLGNRG